MKFTKWKVVRIIIAIIMFAFAFLLIFAIACYAINYAKEEFARANGWAITGIAAAALYLLSYMAHSKLKEL